ncbi:aminotransferase class I/II-fold pyridoxal phosphate-dependent enzyme, partial [Kibdelosporangium lantanae]
DDPALPGIFADALQVPADQLMAAGNSSLELMHDVLVFAQLVGFGPGPWRETRFLCPVPGYDRHFALCERYGMDMTPVDMTPTGPDMDEVEALVAGDDRVKGMWCVPKYSNPDGTVYSEETVRRLVSMPTAAADFRIFWDNAYAVHHLTDDHAQVADVLTLAAEAGNPDRVLVFGSTSKITFAGGGVAFFGSSPSNIGWWERMNKVRSIGPDKVNQLRHARFLKSPEGLAAHMRKHAELIRPKFEAVDKIFTAELSDTATWTTPKGGYFVVLKVPAGCARAVVEAAAEAGIALVPAGSTHPYNDDPSDELIRIAPTYLELDDLETAVTGLALCVKLVTSRR